MAAWRRLGRADFLGSRIDDVFLALVAGWLGGGDLPEQPELPGDLPEQPALPGDLPEKPGSPGVANKQQPYDVVTVSEPHGDCRHLEIATAQNHSAGDEHDADFKYQTLTDTCHPSNQLELSEEDGREVGTSEIAVADCVGGSDGKMAAEPASAQSGRRAEAVSHEEHAAAVRFVKRSPSALREIDATIASQMLRIPSAQPPPPSTSTGACLRWLRCQYLALAADVVRAQRGAPTAQSNEQLRTRADALAALQAALAARQRVRDAPVRSHAPAARRSLSDTCLTASTRPRPPPSTARVKPSRADGVPSSTRAKPSQADRVPSATRAKPSQADRVPSATRAKPSQADRVPNATRVEPNQADRVPSSTRAKPGQADRAPSVTQAKPSLADKVPSATRAKPSQADRVPSATRAKPSQADRVPSATRAKPSQADRVPSATRAEPSQADRVPSATRAEPSLAEAPAPARRIHRGHSCSVEQCCGDRAGQLLAPKSGGGGGGGGGRQKLLAKLYSTLRLPRTRTLGLPHTHTLHSN